MCGARGARFNYISARLTGPGPPPAAPLRPHPALTSLRLCFTVPVCLVEAIQSLILAAH